MKAYVGQTRSQELIDLLQSAGIGECYCRSDSCWPPRRIPWFYDNGGYRDWKRDESFNAVRFMRDMSRLATELEKGWIAAPPDFIVVPDLVAAGAASMVESASWLPLLSNVEQVPFYLAVQNGMDDQGVAAAIEENNYGGIFIGGTKAWKWETAPVWCELGDFMGVPVHLGRCGTPKMVAKAKHLGVSSIDSSFPLWTKDRIDEFIAAVNIDVVEPPTGA